MLLKAVIPGHEGFFIVSAQVMDVLNHKEPLCGPADLGDAGQHPVGKDIAVDPGVAVDPGGIAADGVEQKYPPLFQAAVGDSHKRPVVFLPHVLEHPDGYDLVEASLDLPVVLTEDFHRQIFT